MQIVFPGNYPDVEPKAFIFPIRYSFSNKMKGKQVINNRFFNNDGSLRLELPTGDAVSAVLALDRVEEWFRKFLSPPEKNNEEV